MSPLFYILSVKEIFAIQPFGAAKDILREHGQRISHGRRDRSGNSSGNFPGFLWSTCTTTTKGLIEPVLDSSQSLLFTDKAVKIILNIFKLLRLHESRANNPGSNTINDKLSPGHCKED